MLKLGSPKTLEDAMLKREEQVQLVEAERENQPSEEVHDQETFTTVTAVTTTGKCIHMFW